MEDTLTLDELQLLVDASHRVEHRRNKFAAALKGIDIDDEVDDKFEEVKRQAEAQLAGMSEEEYVFDLIGIEVDADDDE